MVNRIEHISEPQRLILAWQAPEGRGDRTRLAVGELERAGPECVLRYYDGTPDVETAKSLGYAGYPAFPIDPDVPEYRAGVLSAFMRRLPPRSRPDFKRYVERLRLAPDLDLSDFALLAYSEAKLPSDGFSLVNTFEGVEGPCDLYLEIAGFRHHGANVVGLAEGQPLTLEPEPSNPKDPKAMAFKAGGQIVGYVNRLQTDAFRRWHERDSVEVTLERLDGSSEHPRGFVFVKIRPRPFRVAA